MRERRRVTIRGHVQGVFFRDTVRRIALRYEVGGFVRNRGYDTVEIEAEGEPETVGAFLEDILAHPPPDARVSGVQSALIEAKDERDFRVTSSVREG